MGGPSWIIGRNLPQSDQDVSAYLRKQRVRRKSLRDELLAQMSGYDFGPNFGISKIRAQQQEGVPVEKKTFTRMKIEGEDEMIDSGSDRRVENNVVRHEYRVLSDQEKATMKQIKDMGQELLEYLDLIGEGRELSTAKSRIEEAVMWAVKHVTA